MNTALSLAIAGIDASFHEPYASLMKGLVYGLPIQIDPQFKQEVVRSGLAHLVVLSGANVTLLTQFSEKLFFSYGKKIGLVLQGAFLTLFVALVGIQPPLARAVCMFACTAVCIATGRPSSMSWNLFLTIIFVSIAQPKWLSGASFQLSVFATIGIIVWSRISASFEQKLNPLVEVFLESWVVFLVTAPVTMLYFKSISLISPFSTALVSWLVIPLMVSGFLISATYIVAPIFSLVVAIPTQMGLQFIIYIIHISAQVPFGYILFK